MAAKLNESRESISSLMEDMKSPTQQNNHNSVVCYNKY